jgi:hypothetical protein
LASLPRSLLQSTIATNSFLGYRFSYSFKTIISVFCYHLKQSTLAYHSVYRLESRCHLCNGMCIASLNNPVKMPTYHFPPINLSNKSSNITGIRECTRASKSNANSRISG